MFGTKKLRNIGEDLGGAVKGFKKGMKEAGSDDASSAPPQVEGGETIEVTAREKKTEQKA